MKGDTKPLDFGSLAGTARLAVKNTGNGSQSRNSTPASKRSKFWKLKRRVKEQREKRAAELGMTPQDYERNIARVSSRLLTFESQFMTQLTIGEPVELQGEKSFIEVHAEDLADAWGYSGGKGNYEAETHDAELAKWQCITDTLFRNLRKISEGNPINETDDVAKFKESLIMLDPSGGWLKTQGWSRLIKLYDRFFVQNIETIEWIEEIAKYKPNADQTLWQDQYRVSRDCFTIVYAARIFLLVAQNTESSLERAREQALYALTKLKNSRSRHASPMEE